MSDEQKTQLIPIIADLENIDLKQMKPNTIIEVDTGNGDKKFWRKSTETEWCEMHAHCTDCENYVYESEKDPNEFFKSFRIVALPIETVLELLT